MKEVSSWHTGKDTGSNARARRCVVDLLSGRVTDFIASVSLGWLPDVKPKVPKGEEEGLEGSGLGLGWENCARCFGLVR